ncbi:hypothetical protein M433DRAFT_154083 [Acidomyces richmondensis BFW]|nr:MAG: hypothetical protein FE78DRAFT_89960 [Acidomyces sp. 'richmondensis']KYG45860.1 hypothetical protein M433DRAFT_154083 [Acidomyces richmondensis BFW]
MGNPPVSWYLAKHVLRERPLRKPCATRQPQICALGSRFSNDYLRPCKCASSVDSVRQCLKILHNFTSNAFYTSNIN